jgi:hypothetical protein
MVVVMPPPADFGGKLSGILLHRRGRARIDQRHRLRTLDRSGENEKRANGREAENFRSPHQHSPWMISRPRRAAAAKQLPHRDADEIREDDVNED